MTERRLQALTNLSGFFHEAREIRIEWYAMPFYSLYIRVSPAEKV
jgi:hypothetical protein